MFSQTILFGQENIYGIIESVDDEDDLSITGVVFNQSEDKQKINFELNVIKKSGSNSSISKQKGEVVVKKNDTTKLSTSSVNFGQSDSIVCELLIFRGEDLIHKTEKTFQREKEIKLENQQYFDGVVLTNIVFDETITKFGKDYYDYFYSLYNLRFKNVTTKVRILETPFIGRTTKIALFADNNKLYEFTSRPNQEFLETMAKNSVSRLNSYLNKKK